MIKKAPNFCLGLFEYGGTLNRIEACNHYTARLLCFTISFIPTKIPTIRKSAPYFWAINLLSAKTKYSICSSYWWLRYSLDHIWNPSKFGYISQWGGVFPLCYSCIGSHLECRPYLHYPSRARSCCETQLYALEKVKGCLYFGYRYWWLYESFVVH